MSSPAPDPLVVSPDDAAHMLGICRASVYNLMRDGSLPSHHVGRARRIRVTDIEAFLDRHPATPQGAAK